MRRLLLFVMITICILFVPEQSGASEFSLDDAKALAIKAAALIEKEGIHKALKMLCDPTGGFVRGTRGELYVFVLNFDGELLFHPRPDLAGRNALNWKDDKGNYFIREMISIAKDDGQGWIEYLSWDPKSGEVRPKVSFVIRVGREGMLVGAGISLKKDRKFI